MFIPINMRVKSFELSYEGGFKSLTLRQRKDGFI